MFGSRLKTAVDDALTGNTVQMAIQAAVADALMQATVVDALVTALKDHEGFNQHPVA